MPYAYENLLPADQKKEDDRILQSFLNEQELSSLVRSTYTTHLRNFHDTDVTHRLGNPRINRPLLAKFSTQRQGFLLKIIDHGSAKNTWTSLDDRYKFIDENLFNIIKNNTANEPRPLREMYLLLNYLEVYGENKDVKIKTITDDIKDHITKKLGSQAVLTLDKTWTDMLPSDNQSLDRAYIDSLIKSDTLNRTFLTAARKGLSEIKGSLTQVSRLDLYSRLHGVNYSAMHVVIAQGAREGKWPALHDRYGMIESFSPGTPEHTLLLTCLPNNDRDYTKQKISVIGKKDLLIFPDLDNRPQIDTRNTLQPGLQNLSEKLHLKCDDIKRKILSALEMHLEKDEKTTSLTCENKKYTEPLFYNLMDIVENKPSSTKEEIQRICGVTG